MLLQMRNFSRSWLAYGLLGLIILSFAVWGVNDVFSGVGAGNVAEVGGRAITPAQLSRELELTLRGERSRGNNLSQQEAVEAGLHLRVLDSMITRNALYAYAEKLGVSASDAQVGDRIREIPAVVNPVTGSFDRDAYARFLADLRYDQNEFENDMRGDLTIDMMLQAMAAGTRAPSSYGAMVYAYEGETRTVSIAELPASAVGAIPAPTDAQIQAFYEDNQENLRIPEYRALTLVFARPQDFAASVTVPEERLREEFEARRAALERPETRTYVRITAPNEAAANQAAARLRQGEEAEAIAAAMNLQVSRGEDHQREQVPDARVGEAVFAAAAGGAPIVVQGELGPWAVVQVQSVTPAQEAEYGPFRDQLREQIALEEGADLLNEAIRTFEDARAAGTPLAQAAQQARLPSETIEAVDAQGADQNGAPVETVAEHASILEIAFETPESEASDFIPMGEADVIVGVDRIIPESVRPLDEVRGELVQAWTSRERVRRMRELASEVQTAVGEGQSFAAAARARRMNVVISSQSTNRRAAAQIPAQGLAAQLFNARVGDVVSDMRVDGGAMLVAQLEEINRVDPAEAPQAVESARQQIQQSIEQAFVETVQQEVVGSQRARRNEQTLERMFQTGDGAQ